MLVLTDIDTTIQACVAPHAESQVMVFHKFNRFKNSNGIMIVIMIDEYRKTNSTNNHDGEITKKRSSLFSQVFVV